MDVSRSLLEELICDAQVDELGLWCIIVLLREHEGLSDAAERRKVTMTVVRQLLDSGRVNAGYYNPDGSGVLLWDLPTPQIISRINSEWDMLGRDPTIGEIVIFEPSGEEKVSGPDSGAVE